jgi:hypothetical protein
MGMKNMGSKLNLRNNMIEAFKVLGIEAIIIDLLQNSTCFVILWWV